MKDGLLNVDPQSHVKDSGLVMSLWSWSDAVTGDYDCDDPGSMIPKPLE